MEDKKRGKKSQTATLVFQLKDQDLFEDLSILRRVFSD
jgi:hypothetical protein